eukprot:3941810-Rhodomonas_salina.1
MVSDHVLKARRVRRRKFSLTEEAAEDASPLSCLPSSAAVAPLHAVSTAPMRPFAGATVGD